MKRAVELFALERGSSRSCFVEATWWTRSEPEESFISVAMTHWQMVVTRRRGLAWLTVSLKRFVGQTPSQIVSPAASAG
jgi:hypothetical protein